jgi:hypothetical protein
MDRADHARAVWNLIPIVLDGETDSGRMREHWHHLLWPAVELFGAALTWSIGLEVLGYPPTWAHTRPEADAVSASLTQHAREASNHAD